ncbi:MAG: hypothetical protein IKO42_02165 [Opitutales bacterium]|nr:hypothetical protein [Opitutales bacterium]
MEKKLIMLLCGALAFLQAPAAVIVQNTETTTTTTSEAAAEGEGISILTYDATEPPMSVGEAAWALSRASAIVSMDIASDTTVSEAAFALSSLLYKCDKSEAENALKDLFYHAPSLEARVYALIGIYSFGRIDDFNELLNSIDRSAEISAVVGGKPYKVSIEKFFATFKKNPQMFVPTSFPPKNLTFEPPANSLSSSSTTTTTTTTTTTYSNVAFTTWSPAIWLPDLVFWNPFYRPIIVFSHGHRPPRHHIRPPAPRPIPPRPRPSATPHGGSKPPSHAGSKPPANADKKSSGVKFSPARPKVGSSAKGVKNRQASASSLSNLELPTKNAKPSGSANQPSSAPSAKSASPAPERKTPSFDKSRSAPAKTEQRPSSASSWTKNSASRSQSATRTPPAPRAQSVPRAAPSRSAAQNSSAGAQGVPRSGGKRR